MANKAETVRRRAKILLYAKSAINGLTEEAIVEAIGKRNGFNQTAKQQFAKALLDSLTPVLMSGLTPYPDKGVVDELQKHMKVLESTTKKLRTLSSEHPFVMALTGVISRKMTEHGYMLVQLEGIEELARLTIHHTKHKWQINEGKGSSTKLPETIALIIAKQYQYHFNTKPSHSRNANQKTPYSRVCSLVAQHVIRPAHKRLSISNEVQKRVIDNIDSELPTLQPFRVDVSNSPKLKKNSTKE